MVNCVGESFKMAWPDPGIYNFMKTAFVSV
jgi:hypothetical protein